MSNQRITPPGPNAETMTLTPAPVDIDGGSFIQSIHRTLLLPDEQESLTLTGLYDVDLQLADVIDTASRPADDAPEEVVRAFHDGLPAAEFRLLDHRKDKFAPTLNDKGLVDDKALINDVLSTIKPGFPWQGPVDRHHLCWPRADYVTAQQTTPNRAYSFREHGSNVIRVQRVFHNWIHAITLPPPMPDPEVMQYTLQAWEIVGDFFSAVRQTVNHQRLFNREEARRGGYSDDQKDMIREMLLRELSGVVLHLEALQDVPEEYWPFRPDIRLQIAAGKVGQVLTRGYLNRTREVRLGNVA